MRALGLLVASAAALALPAAPAIADDEDDFAVPPYHGVYQPQNQDERGLWTMADEDERVLRDSDIVIRDPALNDFVRGVLCRTVGEDRCENVRIYIVRAPIFNASMTPNGTMRVFSGLLLRMRSEAELASVLGHEFAHFELRHTLDNFRRARTGTDIAAWVTVLGAAASRYGGGYHNGRDVQLAVFGSLARNNRNDERDADLLGFGYLARAGYRPAAAADVWRAVMNEADSTAVDRGRRSRRYDGVAFFASHPTNLERADMLATLANRVPGGDFEGRGDYAQAMEPWLGQFLADELALNDFGGTDFLLNRLAGDGYSPDLLYARGELYRGRGNPRDLVNAAQFYRQAIDLDGERTEAWRGLGLSLMRSGDFVTGSEALRTYLDRAPDAPDAAMLRTMIED